MSTVIFEVPIEIQTTDLASQLSDMFSNEDIPGFIGMLDLEYEDFYVTEHTIGILLSSMEQEFKHGADEEKHKSFLHHKESLMKLMNEFE